MATVAVTINVDSSVLTVVEQALCYYGGFYSNISAANAKTALIAIIRQQAVSYLAAMQAPVAPPTDPTPGLLT